MTEVVDIHPHVISTDTLRYPRAPIGGHQSAWSRDRPVSVEQMLVEQDRAGVGKAALVQASTCYGHDNSYVADAVNAYPERFAGVFSCDIVSIDALEMMTHWMAKGLTGLRLFTTGSTMPGQAGWLDDPSSFPAWRKAEEERLPVCLQMTAEGIPQLVNVLERFPGLRVILDHLARPVQDDGPPYRAAQAVGIDLSLSQQLGLLAVMLFTSKGGAGVAGSAIVVLASTLASAGTIPVASIGLILGVHRLLSSAFVPVNVLGNALATIVIARMERAVDMPTLESELRRGTGVVSEAAR